MKQLSVLLVDDDPDIGSFIKRMLTREAPGFSFAFVESGQECLKYISENEVDCILSDYQMPVMDGMELLLAMRERGIDIPFIFITGQGNEEVAREAFKNGAFDYFTKDIGFAHFARIVNSIEQAANRKAADAEHRRVDDALKVSEQRLHLHVQRTPLGAIEWDVDFRVVSWNPAAEKIFGFAAEEAIGRISNFIIPDSARPHTNHVWDDLINLRGGEQSTNENLTKDGRTILCEWHNTPLVAPDGKVIGVASFVQDVTARQKAESALAESEEKFRNLVEKSLVGVYLIQAEDSTYVFKYVNSTMAGILGYTVDELTGMDVLETGLPEDMPLVKENLRRRLAGEIQSISYGFRCRKKSGEIIDVMVYGTRIMYMGRPAVIGTLLDITERKKAESALAESEEKFRVLVEQAADAFFLHDTNGRIVDVNQQACDSLGYTREELLGMSVLDIEKGFGSGKLADLWRAMTPDNPVTADGVQRRKDGSTFPVEVRVGSLNVGGEQLILALARDVTERKKADDALRASQKFLETIIETEPECVKLITPDGKLKLMNRAGLDMIQAKSLEQVKGKSVLRLIAPEHREAFMQVSQKVFRGEEARLEFDMIGFEGRRLTLETHAVPLRDENDEIIALLGVTRNVTGRKRAEQKISEQRAFLEKVIDSLTHPFYVIDAATYKVVMANAASRIDVSSEHNACYEMTHRLDTPCDGDEHHCPLDMVKRTKEPVTVRHTHYDEKGNERIIEVHGYPVLDDKGDVAQMIEYALDITDRVKAEEALIENEERIRSIMETTDEWIWEIDDKGVHTYSNKAIEKILGYSVEDIVGWDGQELMHEEDRARVEEMLPGLVAEKKGWRGLILRWRRKDGTYRYLESNAVPVLGPNGEVVGFRGADRDITERKRAEDALKESETKFRALVEEANVGVIIIQDGEVVYRNPWQMKMLGYTREELAETNDFMQFIHPDDSYIVREAVRTLFEGERKPRTFEFRVLRKDGGVVYLEAHGCLTDYNGRPAVIGISTDITARKRAEDALLESEARFRALTESTSDWIWETDTGGAYTYSSPKVRDILGYSPDELIGKSAFEIMPPEEAERVEEEFLKLVSSQLPIERLENINITKDGRRVVLETSAVPFFDRDGVFCGYRGIDRDITERKKVETDLRRSEVRLKAILNNIPDIAWLKDTESRLIAVNEAYGEACGVSPDELVWKTDLDIWPRELADKYISDDMEVVKSGKRKSVVEPMVGKDGEKKWIATIKSPIYDEEGNVAGTAGIARDVTEMKRTEEMLQFRNVLLSIQQEASLDGILVVNEKREIISFNTRFAEMWGVPSEVMDKKSGELLLQSVLHKLADPDEFVGRINYIYSLPNETSTEEVTLKDGRTFDRYSAPMLSQDGRYYGRVWYYRDITERKKLEQQRADFYAMLSHDLKSPLMTVTGYADILDARAVNFDEESRSMVAAIHRSCDKLLRLIDDLLSVSRFEAGKLGLDLFPAELSLSLEEACAGLETEMMKKKQKFRLELADDLPEKLVMDKKYVLRAVTNLLQNAVNYTPRGGEITLRAEKREEGGRAFAVVSVIDNGPGIPSSEHSRIFDKYYRVPGTTGVKGTGLGLAIVKAVAEEHGGRVELESEPGKGSAFRLILPVAGAEHPANNSADAA